MKNNGEILTKRHQYYGTVALGIVDNERSSSI